ncbi:MAG: hypothetical protein ABGW82_02395, partial [Paracoccus sp. (in: a-proteobacteria)]
RSRAAKDKEGADVPQFDGLVSFLDRRSFGSIWFWLALVGMWSATGRNVIGVPVEVLAAARRASVRDASEEGLAAITLLDWLSLTLPRWQLGRREGAIVSGVTTFLLTSLAILGFGYELEMAQALALLMAPFMALFWMRVRLARRLIPLLQAGQAGETPIADVAAGAVRLMNRHRRLVLLLSVVSVAATALWGALWALVHPNGL